MEWGRSVALVCLGAALVCAWSAQAADKAEASYAGEALYAENCSSCHGVYAEGDGPVAAVIAVPVPDLTVLSDRNGGVFPYERIYHTIDGRKIMPAHGSRFMPVWGLEFWLEDGADDEAERTVKLKIEALLDFLQSIQNAEPGTVDKPLG